MGPEKTGNFVQFVVKTIITMRAKKRENAIELLWDHYSYSYVITDFYGRFYTREGFKHMLTKALFIDYRTGVENVRKLREAGNAHVNLIKLTF